MFVPGTLLQHEGQVVKVRGYVIGVDGIEVLYFMTDLSARVAYGADNFVGNLFFFFLCVEVEGEEKKD